MTTFLKSSLLQSRYDDPILRYKISLEKKQIPLPPSWQYEDFSREEPLPKRSLNVQCHIIYKSKLAPTTFNLFKRTKSGFVLRCFLGTFKE